MKYLIIFVSILFFVDCNIPKKNVSAEKNEISDVISIDEKKDTLIKISNHFQLNGMLCYWELVISFDENNDEEITMKLKDSNTNKILLEYNDNYGYNVYSRFSAVSILNDYFEQFNFEDLMIFEDLNFDGFKDFYRSEGWKPVSAMTHIYLFNNETKQFEYSEKLSDNLIEDVDSINKILTTSSWSWIGVGGFSFYTERHYFDKFGRIKFTESITLAEEMEPFPVETYEKIINGEVVEIRTYFFVSDEHRRSEYEYFKNDFFPFEFKNYSTQKMMQYFYKGVTVDSIIVLENVDLGISAHKIYTYRLEDSFILFLVKDKVGSNYFYLIDAEIKKDMFKSKNGVGIGISSKDFFRKIKSSQKDYEHFTIEEGEGSTIYNFDLKDGFLRGISLYSALE